MKKRDEAAFKEKQSETSSGVGLFFTNKEDQYMFIDLDLIEKNNEQVRVGVRFAKKTPDGAIENTGITYFLENKGNQWSIINID